MSLLSSVLLDVLRSSVAIEFSADREPYLFVYDSKEECQGQVYGFSKGGCVCLL